MKQKIYFYLILLYFLFGAVNINQGEEINVPNYVVLSQWKLSKKEQKFNFGILPSITVDGKGNVYISNNCFSNKYVEKFSPLGKYIDTISGSEAFLPTALAIDKEGNLYIAGAFPSDPGEFKVLWGITKFDREADLITKWKLNNMKPLSFPIAVALDSEGNIYIIPAGEERIKVLVYSPTGDFLKEFGSYGESDGQFKSPTGIAIDSKDFIYVADCGNNRIQKFTKEGKFVLKWGSKGNSLEQFNCPWGIAIDSLNNVYVTDKNNHRVQIFTEDGKFITSFGKKGKGPGEFNNPCGIAIGRDLYLDGKVIKKGYIYVADSGNSRIQVFTQLMK
ncbi:MAG: 6-bladed beta-propeller [Candidatus Aenigmatarchaeota archaeon]